MQSTKDKILSAVLTHIKEGNNLEQITISKIANEAEIGKSTVYEHFASKEEMIAETYQYLLNTYDSILSADHEDMHFKEAFIEQMKRVLTVMKDAKQLMGAIMNFDQEIFVGYGKQIEQTAIAIRTKIRERFRSIIMIGVIEGVITPKIPPNPHMGSVIQALVSGLSFQYVNHAIEIEESALYELIYHQVLIAIQNS